MPGNKTLKSVIVYVAIEALVFASGLIDYYFIQSDNFILFEYLEEVLLTFWAIGVLFILYFIILRSQKAIMPKLFWKGIAISFAGVVIPFVFLAFVFSHLQ